MIRLSLAYPPSVWKLYRGWGAGRNKTGVYKSWLRTAGNELLATPLDRRSPVSGKFTMTVLAGRPDARARDLDNLLKSTCDLLQTHGLVKNDCLAETITVGWSPNVEKRRIEVWVWALPPEGTAA